MVKNTLLAITVVTLLSTSAFAREEENKGAKTAKDTVKAILDNIQVDNSKFVKSHSDAYFAPFLGKQTPRATIVTCADSRVHDQAFDNTPDSDLYILREIGNQILTAPGSIEYGVNHLNTPLLLIVGHVACGAVTAALTDYSNLEPDIIKELSTIKLTKGETVSEGVKENVNNQVKLARNLFAEKVKEGVLVVVGAVYDFKNDYGQGNGKLVIININGETDPAKINNSPLLVAK